MTLMILLTYQAQICAEMCFWNRFHVYCVFEQLLFQGNDDFNVLEDFCQVVVAVAVVAVVVVVVVVNVVVAVVAVSFDRSKFIRQIMQRNLFGVDLSEQF